MSDIAALFSEMGVIAGSATVFIIVLVVFVSLAALIDELK